MSRASSGSAWAPLSASIDRKQVRGTSTRKYVRYDNPIGDINNYDLGILVIAASSTANAVSWGYVWLEYEIEFYTPQPKPPPSGGYALLETSPLNYTVNEGVQTEVPFNNPTVLSNIGSEYVNAGSGGFKVPANATHAIDITIPVTNLTLNESNITHYCALKVDKNDGGGFNTVVHDFIALHSEELSDSHALTFQLVIEAAAGWTYQVFYYFTNGDASSSMFLSGGVVMAMTLVAKAAHKRYLTTSAPTSYARKVPVPQQAQLHLEKIKSRKRNTSPTGEAKMGPVTPSQARWKAAAQGWQKVDESKR
jgi:hypothetical protein